MKIIPRVIISERINQREIKWGSALSSRGEAFYLSKFWEWSVWIHKILVKRNLPDLASAVYSATKDYSRPNSVYRALCEVWCPDTNTFITTNGEIGISLWDIREITGLSIRAYSLILDKKKTDRIHHADWIEFWFQEDDCVPNPRKSKPFKKAMESKPRKEGQRTVKDRIRRPVVTDRPKETLCRDRSHWNSSLSVDEEEELEIAAYLSLWLCRFIFPSRDDYLRVGTFKTASRMAAQCELSFIHFFLGFPKIPEELNFYTSPSPLLDQNNENLDIIDALDGIDGLNGSKDLPCDYPSHISGGILASKLADINDEGEVNSGTSVVKIPENEQEAPVTPSSLSLIVVPTSNINNRGITPICSSMSGLPFGITEDSSLLKDVFREAMTKYLKKSFTNVIKHGFSNLRTWWAKSNQRLQNLITESFQTDPAPLTRRMEVFLKRVDAYLSKRKQILECPTLEERDQQLKSLNSRIDVEMAIFSSLESKIGQLASELDKLRDELQTRKENLDKMEDARITLEQAQVRNIANVKSIDQERKTLEYNFLQLVESD
ncbi:PMD domain-containing protein [Abeliophyllum distichum]|uniref:PMD domain-containing protein n=1 Tax=Abeliophyllum distichum TaxID=126358 RepID=A0ABD1U0A9_9LAMI